MKKEVKMPTKKLQSGSILNFLAWFMGVIVSLVVGNAMIEGTLRLPGWLGGSTEIGLVIAMVIGWILVITTLIGAIMAIIKK